MNLVVGATGMVGGEICQRLASMGNAVRAMVRPTSDPAKVEQLRNAGVTLVEGDLRDKGSLGAACDGVDRVISTASSLPLSYQPGENSVQNVDLEGVKNLIDAAREAGVSHFIYTSFSKHMDNPFPLRDAKRAVEQHLKDSGLTYTILRPSYFMEMWLSPAVGFDYTNAKAQLYGDGELPISWISYRDVATIAVESLENPAARNAVLELGGPEAISPIQAVRIFEKVGGKPFEVQYVPTEALQAQLREATDPMQQSFAGLMIAYAGGDAIEMEGTLKSFPLRLASVEEYAQRVLL